MAACAQADALRPLFQDREDRPRRRARLERPTKAEASSTKQLTHVP